MKFRFRLKFRASLQRPVHVCSQFNNVYQPVTLEDHQESPATHLLAPIHDRGSNLLPSGFITGVCSKLPPPFGGGDVPARPPSETTRRREAPGTTSFRRRYTVPRPLADGSAKRRKPVTCHLSLLCIQRLSCGSTTSTMAHDVSICSAWLECRPCIASTGIPPSPSET